MEATYESTLFASPEFVAKASRRARIAASLFFFLGLSLYSLNLIPPKIFVPQDPAATAANLLSNEVMFRILMFTNLAGTIVFVFMIMLFYRVFSPVEKHLARLMAAIALMQIPIVFVFEVVHYTALMVLKSDPRATFDLAQQQEAAYLLLRMHAYGSGIGMGKLMFGLAFIPFGMLVIRSGFAPKIIGILLIIGGIGYVADCFTSIVLQRADYLTVRSFMMYTTLCYIAALLWFMIKGLKAPRINGQKTIQQEG